MSGPLETEITTPMIVCQSSWVPDRSGSLETENPSESTRKVRGSDRLAVFFPGARAVRNGTTVTLII